MIVSKWSLNKKKLKEQIKKNIVVVFRINKHDTSIVIVINITKVTFIIIVIGVTIITDDTTVTKIIRII